MKNKHDLLEIAYDTAEQYHARVRNAEPGDRRRGRPRVLWGVASTGVPHLGYLPYLMMLKRLAATGWDVILLISEFHAYLDDQKTSWAGLQEKFCLYKAVFTRWFRDLPKGSFKLLSGSELYLDGQYFLNLMRYATNFPAYGLLESGKGMLRSDEARFAELLYVYTMMFDAVHLDLDLVLCGEDESKVYEVCFDLLKEAGQFSPVAVYLPMMPGLSDREMHASSSRSNVLRLDATPNEIENALRPFRSFTWDELENRANFLSYLYRTPEVFSPDLHSQWGKVSVGNWVESARAELEGLLAPMRFSFQP
jgi:tyrosyl-tRNA synthetase